MQYRNVVPHLLIDIGGTLLIRENNGVYERIKNWMQNRVSIVDSSQDTMKRIAEIIFLSRNAQDALSNLNGLLDLPRSLRSELKYILMEDDGGAIILDGAIDLLTSAKNNGWAIVMVTNVCAWSSDLPCELMQFEPLIITSYDIGYLKNDPKYWVTVINKLMIDPSISLVIGNSIEPDYNSPREAGLPAILINPESNDLEEIVISINYAGPKPISSIGLVAGRITEWASDLIMETPNLNSLVKDVSRKKVLIKRLGKKKSHTLIRRNGRMPALLLDPDSQIETLYIGWLENRQDKRFHTLPRDLINIIKIAGLDFNDFSESELRHFASQLIEAKDENIRNVRLNDISIVISSIKRGNND